MQEEQALFSRAPSGGIGQNANVLEGIRLQVNKKKLFLKSGVSVYWKAGDVSHWVSKDKVALRGAAE